MWDTSCPDWEERLLSGRTLVPELPLFEAEAERGLRIFKRLRVPDMHGTPALGAVAGPWLFPLVAPIFGSYDARSDRRVVQEYFWMVPKKNGKTSTAAAIMVVVLVTNRRPEGEYVLVSSTKEVADIASRQAAGTIRADAELEKLFQIQTHLRRITHRITGATLQIKAADTDVITGGKQVGTLIDELHVLASKPHAAEILLEIRGALAARPDGFLIMITTQSKKPLHGIFKSELVKARQVRDGELKLPILPVLYELPQHLSQNNGWKNKKFWPLVNPNFGRSVRPEFLDNGLIEAENGGADKLALFASQHFNVEIGLSLHLDRWAGIDKWEKNLDPELTLDEIIRRSDTLTIGIDGGGLDDLLGIAVLGRDRDSHKLLSWSHAYFHPMALEKRPDIAARLADFVRDGEASIVDPVSQTEEAIAAIAMEVNESRCLAGVGLDPYGVAAIVSALARAGISGDDKVIGVPQGYKLTGSIKQAERWLADGELLHCPSGMMDWAVSNARVEPKGNGVLITKQMSGFAKVDPVLALIDAIAVMALNPEPPDLRSAYEDRELLVV
ncbi:MAG: terminase large subunit [Methylocella sp.]